MDWFEVYSFLSYVFLEGVPPGVRFDIDTFFKPKEVVDQEKIEAKASYLPEPLKGKKIPDWWDDDDNPMDSLKLMQAGVARAIRPN